MSDEADPSLDDGFDDANIPTGSGDAGHDNKHPMVAGQDEEPIINGAGSRLNENCRLMVGDTPAGEFQGEAFASSGSFSAASFRTDNQLLASADLPEAKLLDKAEVRKSILKGRSELSKSRQKNHALKAADQGASSLHSPFGFQPGTKAHAAVNRKVASAHGTTNNKQKPSRSLSHDDLGNHRLTTSKKVGDEENNIKVTPLAGALATPRSKGKKVLSTADLRGNQGAAQLPAFVTPRRDAKGKRLNVDAAAMFASSGTKNIPKRTKSAQASSSRRHSTATSSKGLPPKVISLDGTPSKEDVALAAQPPSLSNARAHSLGDMPWDQSSGSSIFNGEKSLQGFHASEMTINTKKAWDALGPPPDEHEASISILDVEKARPETSGHNSVSSKRSSSRQGSSRSFGTGAGAGSASLLDTVSTVQQSSDEENATRQQPTRESSSSSKQNSRHQNPSTGKANAATEIIGSSSSLPEPRREPPYTAITPQPDEEMEFWTCWGCEYSNNLGEHLFCGMCGTGRDWLCPSCEHENKSSFNFCGMCGSRKGRLVLQKQQPEGFNMRMRRGRKHSPVSRPSGGSRSSRCPASPKSTASAKSASKRSLNSISQRPRLESDDATNKTDGGKSRSGESVDEARSKDEKRSSRGRGRDSRKKKEREHRTRSSSRGGRDGKERRSRESVVGGDAKRERKPDKKERKSRKGEKERRRTRNSTSVPPAERRDFSRDVSLEKAVPKKTVLKRSTSLSVFDAGKLDVAKHDKAGASLVLHGESDTDFGDDADKRSSSKSWKNVLQAKKSDDHEKILGTGLSTTDHSLWDTSNAEFFAADFDSNENAHTTTSSAGVLATPSIKKRLLKMGGKVGGKLFKSELPMGDDGGNEPPRFAEVTITRNPPSEKADIVGKQQNGVEPPTPSLKKRLLGKISRLGGKSDHGKALPSGVPMMNDVPVLEEDDEIDSGNEKDQNDMDDDDSDDDPLEDRKKALVITARDMRPNRPSISRRKPPNEVRSSRRANQLASSVGANDRPDRLERHREGNRRSMRRTKSSDSVPSSRRSSDSSTISKGEKRGSYATGQDVLGDRLSEAESIDSMSQ